MLIIKFSIFKLAFTTYLYLIIKNVVFFSVFLTLLHSERSCDRSECDRVKSGKDNIRKTGLIFSASVYMERGWESLSSTLRWKHNLETFNKMIHGHCPD